MRGAPGIGSTELQCGLSAQYLVAQWPDCHQCGCSCRACSLCGPSHSLTMLSSCIQSSWRKEIRFPGLRSGIKECCVPVYIGSSYCQLKNAWVLWLISQDLRGIELKYVQKTIFCIQLWCPSSTKCASTSGCSLSLFLGHSCIYFYNTGSSTLGLVHCKRLYWLSGCYYLL